MKTATAQRIGFGMVMVYATLIIAAVGGWVLNIVKIVGGLSEPLTAMFIARIAGVFLAPVGAVLGWF